MTDVFTLLTLPVTSNAFSNYRAKGRSDSDSPGPRKTPRLSIDSDSASASRSRQLSSHPAETNENIVPVILSIVGPQIQHPDHVYDQDFVLIRRSIRVLLTKDTKDRLPATYNRIYDACYAAVCVAKRGEGIYESFKLELERCIGELVRSLNNEPKVGVEFLLPFIDICVWFEKQVDTLQSVLAYFDTKYLRARPGTSSLREQCYEQFSLRVLDDSNVQSRVRTGIEEWVTWERKNKNWAEVEEAWETLREKKDGGQQAKEQNIDGPAGVQAIHPLRPHIPRLIARLTHHDKYISIFEYVYLKCTQEFYLAEAEAKQKRVTPHDFLLYAQERAREEANRSIAALPEDIRKKVDDVVLRSLLAGRLEWIVNQVLPQEMDKGLESQDEHEKNKALNLLLNMFRMFLSVDGQNVILAGFQAYVLAKVKAIVTDEKNDDRMVERLLKLKAYTDLHLNETFAESEPFSIAGPLSSANLNVNRAGTADDPMDIDALPSKKPNRKWIDTIRDAFSAGFKARRNKPAEMIAKHLDREMRKGQKGKSDTQYQKELDAVLSISRFTDDKDVFRAFYTRALAKRLLLEKSASDDFEKAMLKKLKEEYDPEFGMGDKMFTDLSLSRDLMREYQEFRHRNGDHTSLRLNVMVLQSSNWPFSAKRSEVILPADMQSDLTKFAAFYKSKHQAHTLDWEHSLGTVSLRARFKTGEKELRISLYQCLVLLLFNEETKLTYTDIRERTGIEAGELKRTLQSLALGGKAGKQKVLTKHPRTKEVKDDDVFTFNADFTDPAYVVHINTIQVKETPDESKKTQSLIETDRKHVVDAAIVRVMKAKKELHVEQLKTAVIEGVKSHFIPTVQLIKERIDAMVEGEYIKRSDTDMNVFVYLA